MYNRYKNIIRFGRGPYRIVSSSRDNTLKICKLSKFRNSINGDCGLTIYYNFGSMGNIKILPDGRIIGGNSVPMIWNTLNCNCDRSFQVNSIYTTCIKMLLDGRIITGTDDGILKMW